MAAALALLGIEDSVATTVLGTGTDTVVETGTLVDTGTGCGPEAGDHTALRLAYEAAGHHFDGTLTVPALVDTWSGRIVSDHTPDILDDLHFPAGHPAFHKAS
ncbi:hypothetical protein [Streptomyces sp. NBC_01233]|uniref:hypothetical protein n=1 Tax=Streptomyces sp. NBC_01233 TaxID=2903787 RepID=UPI002E0DFB37|nr:hypothetical protein OG332_08210 [Streptomyces sp. NBC_01233]